MDPDEPSLTACRLGSSGAYERVARAAEDEVFATTAPVAMTIIPSHLSLPRSERPSVTADGPA